MVSDTRIVGNLYRDSVSLMRIAADITALSGVEHAFCLMATEENQNLLRDAGILTGVIAAKPNDILIAVQAKDKISLDTAFSAAETQLLNRKDGYLSPQNRSREAPRSIESALSENAGANIALISTPGRFAVAEALKAINLGLNVMIFSDNVSIEDELHLKTRAHSFGLLVMGPDCGTSIIDGVPLGFANSVEPGPVGIVSASGTGLQQVASMLDSFGVGIAQAIGTGGRDLNSHVGGATTKQALLMLADDPQTDVIILISKPPEKGVAQSVVEVASQIDKEVIVCFIGESDIEVPEEKFLIVSTLEDAALSAAKLVGVEVTPPALPLEVFDLAGKRSSRRRYLRGLYSGGTFCAEAISLLAPKLEDLYSNVLVGGVSQLSDIRISQGNTLLDLGEDEFTRGRPHPMIDHSLRNDRLLLEAADSETAIILVDVVLGSGAHADPVGAMVETLGKIKESCVAGDGWPKIVGFVCGTETDPQGVSRQKMALKACGVIVAENSTHAVRVAAELMKELG